MPSGWLCPPALPSSLLDLDLIIPFSVGRSTGGFTVNAAYDMPRSLLLVGGRVEATNSYPMRTYDTYVYVCRAKLGIVAEGCVSWVRVL